MIFGYILEKDVKIDDNDDDYVIPADEAEEDEQSDTEDGDGEEVEEEDSDEYTLPDDEEPPTNEEDQYSLEDDNEEETTPASNNEDDDNTIPTDDNEYSLDSSNNDEGSEDDTDGEPEDSDESEDDTSDEENNEDEGEGSELNAETLQNLEKELYKNMSPKQIEIQNKKLRQNFLDLYNSIDNILFRVDDIPKTVNNSNILNFISKKLSETKDYIYNYLGYTYETNTYIENNKQYQIFLSVLNNINLLFIKMNTKTDK